MKSRIFSAIESYQKIAEKFSGYEPDFDRQINLYCRADAALIDLELEIIYSGHYFPNDIIRKCVSDILPQLKAVSNMEDLQKFLRLPEVQLIKLYA